MLEHDKQRAHPGPISKRANRGVLLACGFIASSAFATPTTCPTGAYTLYLAPNFNCQVGNKALKHFGYRSTGIDVPASSISVTPIASVGNEGLQFAGPWNVGSSQVVSTFQDSLITFAVGTPDPAIPALRLFFNGSSTGTGLGCVAENFCLNHALEGCPAGSSGQIRVTNPPPYFNDQVYFSRVMSVWVSMNI